MQQSFKLIKCPNFHSATIVCLSKDCVSKIPFLCSTLNCKCQFPHTRCKTMKIQALKDYLMNWQKWIGKDSKDFINKIHKIYSNAKDKLNREEKIFDDYCKILFLGKDYTRAVSLLQNRDFTQLSSNLLASSIRKITQQSNKITFDQFSLSQMKKIDEKIKSLTESIETLYKNKQAKSISQQRLMRSNSVILQKTVYSSTQKSNKNQHRIFFKEQNNFIDAIKLKIDLTYPKYINSKIIKQATNLNKIIGKKIKKYHLSFRATQSLFSIQQFYRKNTLILQNLRQNALNQKMKKQFFTVIIIKTQFGKILGGYTYNNWERYKIKDDLESEDQYNPQKLIKNQSKFRSDNYASTYLFSLDLMERYDLLKPQQAIYCGKSSIGFGKNDLKIVDKANLHHKSYCKFPNSFNFSKQPYLNISKSGMILSGSKYSNSFKIQEWESFIAQI